MKTGKPKWFDITRSENYSDDDDDVAFKCADLDVLEVLSLQRIRENKQFLKMAAKYDKDLDLLRRKHEKVSDTPSLHSAACLVINLMYQSIK